MVKMPTLWFWSRQISRGKRRDLHRVWSSFSSCTAHFHDLQLVAVYVILCAYISTHCSFLAWKFHGQRSLVGYSPWGLKNQTQLSHKAVTYTGLHTCVWLLKTSSVTSPCSDSQTGNGAVQGFDLTFYQVEWWHNSSNERTFALGPWSHSAFLIMREPWEFPGGNNHHLRGCIQHGAEFKLRLRKRLQGGILENWELDCHRDCCLIL